MVQELCKLRLPNCWSYVMMMINCFAVPVTEPGDDGSDSVARRENYILNRNSGWV